MLCAFSKSYRSSFTSYIHKHIPISLSLPFSLKSPNPNSVFFSETTSSTTTTTTEHNTTHRKLSSDPHFFLLLLHYIYTCLKNGFLVFEKKKKCIPKWIQPNPITYRVFFFASTSTAKRVICHFWLQLFLSLSLHLCLLISVVVVFFLIESRK